MLIGTRGGEIVSIQGQDTQVLMRSHSNNELWGLAVHPREKTMTTWDRAGQLCVWDIEARVMKQSCVLQTGGDSLAYSTLGKYLAVG
jgi:WD40 repeat protein